MKNRPGKITNMIGVILTTCLLTYLSQLPEIRNYIHGVFTTHPASGISLIWASVLLEHSTISMAITLATLLLMRRLVTPVAVTSIIVQLSWHFASQDPSILAAASAGIILGAIIAMQVFLQVIALPHKDSPTR